MRRALLQLGDVFDVEVDGLRVRCHVADNAVERAILERGTRAISTVPLITDGLRPGDVFFDIGANCGLFTLVAANRVGTLGRVVAIEPLPAMIERLRFNVGANDFTNVLIIEAAVGDDTGTATLHVDIGHLGHSCFVPMDGYEPVSVPVTPLEKIVRSAGVSRIDALKIDIEGHEDRALLPYVAAVPRDLWPRMIMMETLLPHRWRRNCVDELIQAGYRQVWRSNQDILLEL